MHSKFDGVDREIIGQLGSKLVKPPADDIDGIISINVVMHQIGVCGKYFGMRWEVEGLEPVHELLAVAQAGLEEGLELF